MLLSSVLALISPARPWKIAQRQPTAATASRAGAQYPTPLASGSDEALFRAHTQGEPGAFAELFQRYAARIYAVMRQRGLSEADAQDTVQQAFLRAHQARHDFRQGMLVRPWLWTIAFNLMRDGFRRQATRQRSERVLEDTLSSLGTHDATSSPEVTRAVRQAIAKLSDSHREVVLLHWYEGLSFAEIALVVGASENAVKVRAHRAYGKLRETLREEPEDDRLAPVQRETAVVGGQLP